MPFAYGPTQISAQSITASNVTVTTPAGPPAILTVPVTVDASGRLFFEVANAGTYIITVKTGSVSSTSSVTLPAVGGGSTAPPTSADLSNYALTSDLQTGLADAKNRANHSGGQLSGTITNFVRSAQDAAALLFTQGAHSGVNSIYDVNNGRINATVTATGSGSATPTYANAPAGSAFVITKTASGVWPVRPSARSDLFFFWKGPDPSPSVVTTGTGGMLDGIDVRLVTP